MPDDPKGFAKRMASDTKLKNVVNCYMTSQRHLKYGQLGCSGFIVFDKGMKIVTTSTPSFMKMRKLAFKSVDYMLDHFQVGRPAPRICPGETLEVRGLQDKPEYNGEQAICVGASIISGDEEENHRYEVYLMRSRKTLKIKSSNLFNLTRNDEDPDVNKSFQHSSCTIPRNNGYNEQGDIAEIDNLASLDKLSSTKVSHMDDEHDLCIDLLKKLAEKRTPAALKAVYGEMVEHFEHEEQLFKKYKYGDGKKQFSATKGHIEEHERMTDELLKVLIQSYEKKDQLVPKRFIQKVIHDFVDHVEMYDTKYAEFCVVK